MKKFEEIYRKHVDAVFRYSLRCIGRRHLAEEITSEAFLALYQNIHRIDPSQLPGWLFTVAKNRAVDHWRKSAREELCGDPPEEPRRGPEFRLEAFVLESKALKPVHRVCLILRFVHGMTRSEIARQTGLSETQIKGYLQYALHLLRKELAGQPSERDHAASNE